MWMTGPRLIRAALRGVLGLQPNTLRGLAGAIGARMPKPRKRPAQTHSEAEIRIWIVEAAAAGPVDSPLDCVKCAHRINNAVGMLGMPRLTPHAVVQIDEWTCRLLPAWLRHRNTIDAACLSDPPLTWCGLSGSPVEIAFDYGRRVVSLAWLSRDPRMDNAYSAIVNAGLPPDGAPTPLGAPLWASALPIIADGATGLCPSFELQGILRDRLNRLATRLGSLIHPPESTANSSEVPAFTKSQRRVIQAMGRFDGSYLLSSEGIANAMEKADRLSERTIGPIVVALIELGMAERPEGHRKGSRLTTKGRQFASKIAD